MSRVPRRSTPFSTSDLEQFCHLVGRSMAAGQSFVESVESYGRTSKWDAVPVTASVRNGEDASAAMQQAGGFPDLLIGMVEVGEASGRLDQTFLRLADYYRELVRSKRAFHQGIVWPALQLFGAVAVLTFLFIALDYLQRKFPAVVAPDLFGLGLSPLQNLLFVWGVAVTLAIVSFAVLLWLRSGRIPTVLASFVAGIPWVGTTWKRISTSRFAWGLGAAIDAGTDAVTAMQLAVRGSGDKKFQQVESDLVDALQRGESFEAALASTGKFPTELVQAVSVGESTGQITECVQRLADDYDEQNALALRRFGQVSGLAVSLSMIALLGLTIVSMYTNYLGMVTGALQASSQTLEQIRGDVLAGGDISSVGRGTSSLADSAPGNELIQTRDRMVKDFVENNEDFKKIESIYSTMSRFNEMTPNEFLDAIGGETPAQKAVREGREMREKDRSAAGGSGS